MGNIKENFGRRFRALRESRKHSREFLAQKVKLEPTSIFRIEKGQQWLAPETLERVAEFYGVSPAVFFTDDVIKIEPTAEEALDILSKALKTPSLPSLSGIDRSKIDRLFAAFDGKPELFDAVIMSAVKGIESTQDKPEPSTRAARPQRNPRVRGVGNK